MNTTDVARIVFKIVAPVARRMRLSIGRGLIKLIDDTQKCQEVQVALLADEVHDKIERFQEFGFTSVPPEGAEAITVSVTADRSHSVVIATEDRRYRPKNLKQGEVALYTKQNGKRVYAKENGDLLLGSDPTDAVALAPASKTQMEKITTYLTALDAVFQTTINEPGMGAPSVLGLALKAASQAIGGVPEIEEPGALEVKAK